MSDIAVDVRACPSGSGWPTASTTPSRSASSTGAARPHEDFWALNDVSLHASARARRSASSGRNGSGKSTLLKCICGVLQPTAGEVVVRGKLAGLLELGAGFQQDLTGRENIYLNGSLLGMSKREVDAVFDDIVDFSELEEFIDSQVKFYSSGMYVRLGFAVAVNVDPDVLVIDEVLAVGDERFQRKCIDRVKAFQTEGRTILLVTHSPDQVRAFATGPSCSATATWSAEGAPGRGGPHLPGGPAWRRARAWRSPTRRSWPCQRRRQPRGRGRCPTPSIRSGSAPSTASTSGANRCPTCARATT